MSCNVWKMSKSKSSKKSSKKSVLNLQQRKQTFPKQSLSVKEAPFLFSLFKLVSSKQKPKKLRHQLCKLIESSKEDEIQALSECSKNLLEGGYPNLTSPLYRRLSRYKTVLRSLSSRTLDTSSKKKLLKQKGGQFFSALLAPIIAGVVGTALSHL